jgi:ATP-binding cassette subfamily B protein
MEPSHSKRVALSPNIGAWRFTYLLSKQYWFFAIPALFVVFVAQAAGVSLSYILKELVDALATSEGQVMLWAWVYIGLFAVSQLGWRSSGYLGMLWITRTRALAASSLFSWLSQHSSSYFADRFAGSLATKVTNASNGVSNMLPRMLWNFFPTFLKLFLSIGLAYLAKPMLALIMAIWSVFFLALNAVMVRKKAILSEASATAYTSLKGQLVDIITNIRAVHQFAHLGREKDRAERYIDNHRQTSLRSWRYSEIILVVSNIMQNVLLIGVVLVAIALNRRGELTIGEVVMIINLAWGLLDSLLFIGNSLNGMMENYGEVKEGLDMIVHPHEIQDVPEAAVLRAPKGAVSFEKVKFSYGGRRNVFENFSLEIPAGQKVGLVGESGAGKSTFTQLLLRMYDVESGRINIDGQQIAEVTQESLRSSISYVPQSSMLFHRSLKENILYGNPEASEEEVILAAKQAGAHDFIMDLEKGYDTLVGERGVKLSGGQAQRISIARAMLKAKAPILILDEATSSLDSESEHIVQQALNQLIQDRTVIAIAHRLSTLLAMDRILVLDKGQIVEDGSHAELLAKGGIYARLWSLQAGGFLGGEEPMLAAG